LTFVINTVSTGNVNIHHATDCGGEGSVKEHASPPNVSFGAPLIAKSAVKYTFLAVQ
jgi:hypothetical protein